MSQQVDIKSTKQIRIDTGLHRLLKIMSARVGKSIKELVEGCLADLLAEDKTRDDDYEED